MKRAFTLIELLVIIAIMGTMVTVGIVSIRQGKSRSQLAGAARDIMAVVRQARSIALITQKPAVIRYANEKDDSEDGEPVVKVTVKSEQLFDDDEDIGVVHDLEGNVVTDDDDEEETPKKAVTDSTGEETAKGGETLNEILMPEISKELTKGLRIKVLKEDEQLATTAEKVYKSSISIFSTVDYIKSTVGNKTATVAEKKESGAVIGGQTESTAAGVDQATDQPVEIAWETNGRAAAHTIWIYADGTKPEDGLSLEVDKFGEVKVSQWKDDED